MCDETLPFTTAVSSTVVCQASRVTTEEELFMETAFNIHFTEALIASSIL